MHVRLTPRLGYTAAIVLAIAALVGMLVAHAVVGTPKAHAAASSAPSNQPMCTQRPQLCTQVAEPWDANGQYTGHDEPAALFYSTVPGSGNSNLYHITLPPDPVAPPKQGWYRTYLELPTASRPLAWHDHVR